VLAALTTINSTAAIAIVAAMAALPSTSGAHGAPPAAAQVRSCTIFTTPDHRQPHPPTAVHLCATTPSQEQVAGKRPRESPEADEAPSNKSSRGQDA
jgi:hypothetical protein